MAPKVQLWATRALAATSDLNGAATGLTSSWSSQVTAIGSREDAHPWGRDKYGTQFASTFMQDRGQGHPLLQPGKLTGDAMTKLCQNLTRGIQMMGQVDKQGGHDIKQVSTELQQVVQRRGGGGKGGGGGKLTAASASQTLSTRSGTRNGQAQARAAMFLQDAQAVSFQAQPQFTVQPSVETSPTGPSGPQATPLGPHPVDDGMMHILPIEDGAPQPVPTDGAPQTLPVDDGMMHILPVDDGTVHTLPADDGTMTILPIDEGTSTGTTEVPFTSGSDAPVTSAADVPVTSGADVPFTFLPSDDGLVTAPFGTPEFGAGPAPLPTMPFGNEPFGNDPLVPDQYQTDAQGVGDVMHSQPGADPTQPLAELGPHERVTPVDPAPADTTQPLAELGPHDHITPISEMFHGRQV